MQMVDLFFGLGGYPTVRRQDLGGVWHYTRYPRLDHALVRWRELVLHFGYVGTMGDDIRAELYDQAEQGRLTEERMRQALAAIMYAGRPREGRRGG
jgi:hypothetical protein